MDLAHTGCIAATPSQSLETRSFTWMRCAVRKVPEMLRELDVAQQPAHVPAAEDVASPSEPDMATAVVRPMCLSVTLSAQRRVCSVGCQRAGHQRSSARGVVQCQASS